MPRVVVTIVANNRMKFLPEALAALEEQTFKDVSVIVVDNGSSDGLEPFLRGRHPRAMIVRNTKDLGYSHAQNQAIVFAQTHLRPEVGDLFILTLDPGVILEPDCLERLVNGLQAGRRIGSAGGKILRSAVKGEGEFVEHVPTGIVDSLGLRLGRTRAAVPRAAGERDADGMAPYSEEVFGVPAALALYRYEALQEIRHGHEFFDETFFAHLADADLAWRLRDRGWSSVVIRSARAYHRGTGETTGRHPFFASGRLWLSRPPAVRSQMRRNGLLLVAKNERLANFLLNFPALFFYGLGSLIWCCLVEPVTLTFIPQTVAALPSALVRRLRSRAGRVPAKEIRAWLK